MELVRRERGRDEDLTVRLNEADVAVGELAAALGGELSETARLYADGRSLRLEAEVVGSGVCRGAVLSTEPQSGPASEDEAAGSLQLCVIGGVDAGRVEALHRGVLELGRDPQCDVVFADRSVSRRHCEVTVDATLVEVRDLGGKGGTWVDGERIGRGSVVTLKPSAVVEIGTVAFVVRARGTDDRPTAVDPARFAGETGEIPFNRPRRRGATPAPAGVRPPKAPPRHETPRFNVVAVVTPIVAGAVMIVALKNWLYAVIAGLTPVMAIFNWVGGRRRAGRTMRASDRTFRAELQEFGETLSRVVAVERERREDAHPDLAEILRRASTPSVRLWERRPTHADYLHLSLAHGPLAWQPPIEQTEYGASPAAEVAELVEAASILAQVPITADLREGPVGVVGERDAVLPLVRALMCQAAVLHGPSDLPVLVLADEERTEAWDWAKWLPHVRDLRAGDERLLRAGPASCNAYVEALLEGAPVRRDRSDDGASPFLFTVVDSERLIRGKHAPVRDLLKGVRLAATGIVIAPTEDLLPASCTTIVECHDVLGEVTVTRPEQRESHQYVVGSGLSEGRARGCALALARFEDPESAVPGATLPRSVRIGSLLGPEASDEATIRRRWAEYGRRAAQRYREDPMDKPPMQGPIGRTENGVLQLDIVGDGPHGLAGGTTGSGKTELLRSIVLGLAAAAGPEHLNFVFIDFKGGAGLDKLSELPHCVGLATNLNRERTERLVACLESELVYRQTRFAEAKAPVDDLHKYWQLGSEPLPRLLVVIDELAELVDAVPDITTTLVRIGRIGRTLGVHLLLATQRPGGVITKELSDNTNYALALRVKEASSSIDIIGIADAASIPARNAAGRAFLRVGSEGAVATLFQSAHSFAQAAEESRTRVEVARFSFGASPEAAFAPPPRGRASGQTELERIVDTMVLAHERSEVPAPRRPWTDPLPGVVPLDDLLPDPSSLPAGRPEGVTLAQADDVAAQKQRPFGWDLTRGNLLVYGVVGSGTTTALAAVAVAVDRLFGEQAWTYVLDYAAGELVGLEERLESVGDVVTSVESERQLRLVGMLLDELDGRKSSTRQAAAKPSIFLLVDGFRVLLSGASDEVATATDRIFSEGPDVGIHVAAAVDRPLGVPNRLADLAPQKWVMRLGDQQDYTAFGIRKRLPAEVPPGRAFVAGTELALQIGKPGAGASSVARGRAGGPRPPRVGSLPGEVSLEDLPGVSIDGDVWEIPVGIGYRTLRPFLLRLHPGEHAVVAGQARSGKSSLLAAIAALARRGLPTVRVLALLGRPSPPLSGATGLELVASVDELVDLVEAEAGRDPLLVLVDDASRVADPMGRLEAMLAASTPAVHAVVSGRTDELRQGFGHWAQNQRRSRSGVVLKVAQRADGDAIGVELPYARSYDTRPGRGFAAVDGEVELVQVPLPRAARP